MLSSLKRLFLLLNSSQKRRFYALQFLVLLMAFGEIIGVASIIPFMSLVGDMSQLDQDTFLAKVFKASNFESKSQFVFFTGITVLLVLLISALISMFTLWRMSMFAHKLGSEIADSLYVYYLKQDWLFHSSGSSAQLTKSISNETSRITGLILTPLLQMNARIGLALLMTLVVLIYDPYVALVGILVFSVGYFVLYNFVRLRLHKNGVTISEVLEERFRLMNEGFGGVKDILLFGRDRNFIELFKKSGDKLAYSYGTNSALSQVPRFLMELIAFGSMILLVLYLINSYDGDLGMILPRLSAYALVAFKLLPAFQQIYSNFALLKGHISAFDSIEEDLENAVKLPGSLDFLELGKIKPKNNITLKNITFTYPNKSDAALDKLNISFPANSVIGLVGASGSGKSTLIDVILGLIKPQSGHLEVDEIKITNKNCRKWQNVIGFVPQSIFLSEGTISENVAFGIPEIEIDLRKVRNAIKLSHLDEFVENLEKGIHTKVGERGVQLSGGQRQRIGIARALYHEADVLVFDEATSSLDGISEKMIMDAIHNFSGKKTIIIVAHRLKTVEKCDQIFFIDKGRVCDKGTYSELIEKNEHFRNMAKHA
tara:strand:+ start:6796 stop:8592 length:1797 start_codon:yes stop_codon:yes gene_type:complete